MNVCRPLVKRCIGTYSICINNGKCKIYRDVSYTILNDVSIDN